MKNSSQTRDTPSDSMRIDEDKRREAAIASTASLNPKFTPSSDGAKARLSKFQELHKRRLQIKEKSKIKKKLQGRPSTPSKLEEKDIHSTSKIPCKTAEDTSNSTSLDVSSMPKAQIASKKPQKLHWGLDTKERWERKSNM